MARAQSRARDMLASSREKLWNYAETWKRKKRAGVREVKKRRAWDVKIKIFFYNCTKLAYMHLISWNCILTYFFLSHSLHTKPPSSTSQLSSIRILCTPTNMKIYSILRRMLSCLWATEAAKSIALGWVQCSGLNYFHFFDNKNLFFSSVERERKISRKSSARVWGRVKRREEKFSGGYVWEKKRCAVKKKLFWNGRGVLDGGKCTVWKVLEGEL